MPKFLVTSGSHFQPFTYDELAKPVTQAVEAHNSAQDAYDTIVSETEALRQYLIREPENSEARRMYDSYVSKLERLQNNLWSSGYNAGTRRDLAAARAGYASDITRLGTAIKARQDRSAEYWKTKHEHPDMIMSSDPGLESLDKYIADDRFGQDYYSYSGDTFMNEVMLDAKAMMNDMLDDPQILDKYPQLAGYIPVLKRDGFTSNQVESAVYAVREAYKGNIDPLKKLDPASLLLASTLSTHLDSTGARGKVSPSEFNRLIDYGAAGLKSTIGKSDVSFVTDLNWANQQKINLENLRHKHAIEEAAVKKGLTPTTGGSTGANIAELRGNTLSGNEDKKESEEYKEKMEVYEVLSNLNELKKGNSLWMPDGVTLSDTAMKEMKRLIKRGGKMNKYYEQLTGGQKKFIQTADLDAVLEELGSELNKSATNDHYYSFKVKPEAVSNIAQNVFKLNIGQLSGKDGDSVAGSYAKYANKENVKAKDLQELLQSNNLDVGFDAKSGKITLQRKKTDDSEHKNYDDRIVYLDPKYLLRNISGVANKWAILYAYDETVANSPLSREEKLEIRRKIENGEVAPEVIDLSYLADLIHTCYEPFVKNGTPAQAQLVNALVESLGVGLFYSANTSWAPDYFKAGWSAKAMGASLYDEDEDDDSSIFLDDLFED